MASGSFCSAIRAKGMSRWTWSKIEIYSWRRLSFSGPGRSGTGSGGGDNTWASLVLTSLSISYLTALREGIVCFLTRDVLNKVGEGLVLLPRFCKDKLALLVPGGRVGVSDNVKPLLGRLRRARDGSTSCLRKSKKERKVRGYKPYGCHCDVDGLVAQEVLEVVKAPCLGRSPAACRSPHHKRGVSRDISHEL